MKNLNLKTTMSILLIVVISVKLDAQNTNFLKDYKIAIF